MTKIQAKNRVRDVTLRVSTFVKPTHTIKKKLKNGRETLPLAIPQVELLSEFYEKRNFDRYSWFSAQRSILG